MHEYMPSILLSGLTALLVSLLQSFWWPNIALLGIFFGTFTVSSYLVLHFYVKEKR